MGETMSRDIPPKYLNQIVTGDSRELAERIPDESVDLIFTDPVYDRIDDYRWLAETAVRVLKPGGCVIAQVGDVYRYDAETAMRESSLTPLPLLAEVFNAAYGQLWTARTLGGWKAYVWMSKGARGGDWCFTRHFGNGRKKDYHKWGDSDAFVSAYVERLTVEGGAVFDPFTGSGTVPDVCQTLGRNYIAFEIDIETAQKARARLAGAQMLLLPMPMLDSLRRSSEQTRNAICSFCGETFPTTRSDAQYCKDACRQASYRRRVTLSCNTAGVTDD